MNNKLRAIKNIIFGKYIIIRREGQELIIENNLTKPELKRASCLFFKEAHTLTN